MGRARYFLVAATLSALAGCGGNEIDVEDKEREIAKGVEERTGTQGVSVDCPDGVEKKKDDVFECALTADGGVKATVKVTQVDDDGRIFWEVNP